MQYQICRRGFMNTTLAGLVLAGGGAFFGASARQTGGLSSHSIAEGFTVIRGQGANSLVATEAGGLLVVDCGSPEDAKETWSVVRTMGQGPVVGLFNTHWHTANTGGNEAFGKRGVPIIAHENTALWMGTEFYEQQSGRTIASRPSAAQPTQTFYTTADMQFGDEPVSYGHLPSGHTDGDIYVHFHKSNVLAVGGALAVGHYPHMDYSTGGWIGGVAEASQALLDLADDDTLIVAGDGPVQRRSALQAQYDMASTLRDRFIDLIKQGMSVDDILAADATREFDENWGEPAAFVANAYRGLWGHFNFMGIA